MRPLLIGQAPGPNTDPSLPLFPVPRTSAGGKLQQLTGLTRGQYLKTFDRVNLLPYFPGRTTARDDTFPMTPAKLAAQVTMPLLSGRTVVLVGRNVANAFRLGDLDFHAWKDIRVKRACLVQRDRGTARIAVVPHPSGRNHWYNKEANRQEAKAFWADFRGDMPHLD